MRDYRNLVAWRKAHEVTKRVYALTGRFPEEERYGLAAQLRRCATSVPSNIAEGAGRSSKKEFKRYLSIAAGSASEMQYQLELAQDLGYFDDTEWSLITASHEVKRIIWGLLRST